MKNLRHAVGSLATPFAVAAACSFAPIYRIPSSAPPTSAYNEQGDWLRAQPLDDQSRGSWWTTFGDAQLDALWSL